VLLHLLEKEAQELVLQIAVPILDQNTATKNIKTIIEAALQNTLAQEAIVNKVLVAE
jgi:hypothetical protein